MPRGLAGVSLGLLVLLLLHLAAGPLTTNDLWWHMAHGRAHAAEGLTLSADPCLHTAEAPPPPHQWLFGVAAYAVERAFGLHGLRVLHAAGVLLILALAWASFRRAGSSALAACAASGIWILLAWFRLVQLRPDLPSIAATLLLYRLLLAPPGTPSWGRVAATAALFAVWANVHTLFLLGPVLLAVGVVAATTEAALGRWRPELDAPGAAARARRLAWAWGLGLLASLLNPRGPGQHLAFLDASREGAIWMVLDEWTRFDPWAPSTATGAVSTAAWILTDALLLAFAAVGALRLLQLLRNPTRRALERADLLHLGLGLAGAVALLTAVRFLWLGILPLLFLLRAGRMRLAAAESRGGGLAWGLALASAALALAFPLAGGYREAAGRLPQDLSGWLTTPYPSRVFHEEAVRFLAETRVEGRLFNTYPLGGFLCWKLAPRLRTYVDGSLNYPLERQREYHRLNAQRGTFPGETQLDVLDRRGIDFYLGVGVPRGNRGTPERGEYTTANLERAPGWRLVSRSQRHAIYLRATPRNVENLERIAAWYERQGIPFDPTRGLDVSAVIRVRPDWAAQHELLSPYHADWLAARHSQDPGLRFAGLERLGTSLALAGAYDEQIAIDLEARRLRPDAKGPLRRLVYGLLRRDRSGEALALARRLRELDPGDHRSSVFLAVAQHYRAARQAASRDPLRPEPPLPLDAVINQLPLVEPQHR